MALSALTSRPEASTTGVSGREAMAEHSPATPDMLARAASSDYHRWLSHIGGAAGCSYPIRLHGHMHRVNGETAEVLDTQRTTDMPDAALYVPCKNRRATVCPSCSEVYRADTFQLVRAGLTGGKSVPTSVTEHPCVFLTLTAPSFGPVHTHAVAKNGRGTPCRPRRDAETCPHGVRLACDRMHEAEDRLVGSPLCIDCYDYDGHAVWNAWAGELWRRTTIAANRSLRFLGKSLGARFRLSYAKVAEYQRRGLVHFHALVRLDGVDEHDKTQIIPPHPAVTADYLASVLDDAARSVAFHTPAHPSNENGWLITWGRQIDTRTVRLRARDSDDRGEVTTTAVAAYLAKYATKASEAAGIAAARFTHETVWLYADPARHSGRLVRACWQLGQRPCGLSADQAEAWHDSYGRLRRWAHMLGFGGHFSTKSRRYSTTLGALREARRIWQREQTRIHEPAPARSPGEQYRDAAEDTVLVINDLVYAGLGWHTTADAVLANTAAAKAREHRRIAREELEHLAGSDEVM